MTLVFTSSAYALQVGTHMELGQQLPAATLSNRPTGLGTVAYLPGGPHHIATARTDGAVRQPDLCAVLHQT